MSQDSKHSKKRYIDGYISGIVMDRLGRRAKNYSIKASIYHKPDHKHFPVGNQAQQEIEVASNHLLDAECKTNTWAGRYILHVEFKTKHTIFEVKWQVFSESGEMIHSNENHPYYIFTGERHFQQDLNIILPDVLIPPIILSDQNTLINEELGDFKNLLKEIPKDSCVDIFASSWSRKGVFEDMGLEVFYGKDVLGNLAFSWIGIGTWGWNLYRFHPYGVDSSGYGIKEPRVARKIVAYDCIQRTPDHITQGYDELLRQPKACTELSHGAYAGNKSEDAWQAIRQRLTALMEFHKACRRT